MATTSLATDRTLLCVGNYDRNTGYAWRTIRQVWNQVAERLAEHGVRTLVVERERGGGEGQTSAGALVRLECGWNDWDDLVEICRREQVDCCWLTDREILSRDYGKLRAAGVRKIVNHERTSGARDVPTGIKRFVKGVLARRPAWTADRYVAISDFVQRRLLETGRLPQSKVSRIYNAIDTARWSEPIDRDEVRRRLGLNDDRPLVVSTSRAQSYKGIGSYLEAVHRISAQRSLLAVHCGDGPELDLFRARLCEMNDDRIRLLGAREDYRDLVRAADLVVVPPHWSEAFGLTVVEAMAAGRPLVATAVGAIPELVGDGEQALLVEPKNVAQLNAAIVRLLDDRPLAAQLGTAAQRRATEQFDFSRLASELEQLFLREMS
jgi:glycosyltransferase involved in cell wall biosynthesis